MRVRVVEVEIAIKYEDLASCISEITDVGQLATSPPSSESGAI